MADTKNAVVQNDDADETTYKLTIKSTDSKTSKSQTLSINRIKPTLVDSSSSSLVSAFIDQYEAVYSDVTVDSAEFVKTEKTILYNKDV